MAITTTTTIIQQQIYLHTVLDTL